jgi:hypothetical protein
MSLRTELVQEALRWPGHDFHPGVSAQCAAFVAACLDAIGYNAPAWQALPNKNWVPDYQSLGSRLATADELRAGDLSSSLAPTCPWIPPISASVSGTASSSIGPPPPNPSPGRP